MQSPGLISAVLIAAGMFVLEYVSTQTRAELTIVENSGSPPADYRREFRAYCPDTLAEAQIQGRLVWVYNTESLKDSTWGPSEREVILIEYRHMRNNCFVEMLCRERYPQDILRQSLIACRLEYGNWNIED